MQSTKDIIDNKRLYLELGLASSKFFMGLKHDGDAVTKVGHQLGPDWHDWRQGFHGQLSLMEPLEAVALKHVDLKKKS